MDIFYSDIFSFPLFAHSRFPADKYRRVRLSLETAVSPAWNGSFKIAPAASGAELLKIHSRDYVQGVLGGNLSPRAMRRIGFPWSEQLAARARHSTGGTIAACQQALAAGMGVNLGGGTHHAFRDFGSGFCVFNDVAVAVRTLQDAGFRGNILVLDCDVHQGDGTAALLGADPRVFTFSIHGKNNFPRRKVPGDLDIDLDDGAGDDSYLLRLTNGIDAVLDGFAPDLVVFVAGADPYRKDRYGRLSLTKAGLRKRDHLVLHRFRAAKVPLAVVLGGGYAPDIADIVDIHCATVMAAARYA